MTNGTLPEQTANATEVSDPGDPLDLPANPKDFGLAASLPSLASGSESVSLFAPAAEQPLEYVNARDLLVQVFNLWETNAFTDPGRVLELARLALIRQPTSHIALNNMGVAYHSLGEYEQAMDAYTQAIELKNGFLEAYHNRAQLHYLRGEYDQAIKDYSKVLRINSEYINARTHRALAYGKVGDAGRMCSDLATACEIGDCSFFEAAKRLGDCP
jgi:tetratricopeptide (TPR) repeat protein